MEIVKRELERSLEQATDMQNPLNKLVQELEYKLELSQNFFLGDNVNCGQQQILFLKKNYVVVCAGENI